MKAKPAWGTVLTLIVAVFLGADLSAEQTNYPSELWQPQANQSLEPDFDRHTNTRGGQSSLASANIGLPDLEVTWVGAVQWATGVNWGGEGYGGSLGFGPTFFGSNLSIGDYIPVELVFSTDSVTFCHTFRRDLGYAPGGVGQFPGYALDISDPMNPRRLNICFVEDNNLGAADLLWEPTAISPAKREYVLIMLSDYDGDGLTYSATNLLDDGPSMDILYGWWPAIASGQTFMSTLPASLEITPHYLKSVRAIPDDGQLTLTWFYDSPDADEYLIYKGTSNPPTTLVTSVGASQLSYTDNAVTNGVEYFYRVDVENSSDELIEIGPVFSGTPQVVSSSMDLLGTWHQLNTYGDVWGYTDPGNGREYALICARNDGVAIVDITDMPPVLVSFIPSLAPGTDAKDVKIYDHYAIIIKENEPVQIVDIDDVANPVEVSQIQPVGGSGAHNCMVDGDYLYIVGNHNIGGLEIYDISDPSAPDSVSVFQPFYYHDVDIRNDVMAAAGIYGDGVDLLDLSDKSNPSLIKRFNYAGSGAHNCEFTPDGNYLFIGDEIGTSGNHTRVFDISDTENISLVAEIVIDPLAVTHNCYQRDGLLYIGHYTEGIRVWDIADPTNPFEVAYYDSYLPSGYGYSGCWSVYPYFASGKVIASDMQTGLYVLDVNLPGESCCTGTVGDANGGGEPDPTVADIGAIVDLLFISGTVPVCLEEADVNQSGGTDPQVDDITIADIGAIVDFLFITGSPLADCQ